MIYGIGPKALGEQLGVDDNDAAAFIETFKAKYPGRILFVDILLILYVCNRLSPHRNVFLYTFHM